MSGRENLVLVGRLFGHDARQAKASAEAVLDLLDLTECADRLIRTYSGGMRRKLDLGAACWASSPATPRRPRAWASWSSR